MKKIILSLCCFALISLIRPVQAVAPQPMLSVSPVIIHVLLSPGKTYDEQISVQNLLDIPLPLKALMDNFDTDEEGGFNPTSTQSPLLQWITVESPDLLLQPHEKSVVNLTIKIPDKVPVGGYYGVLFLQPLTPAQSQFSSLINAKIGVIVLADIGVDPLQKTAQISTFSYDQPFFDEEPISFNLRVKNTSLSHLSAKPVLTIHPLLGKEQKVIFDDKFIFPGKTRHWHEKFNLESYWHLLYETTVTISLGNGKQVSQRAYLIAFPRSSLIKIVLPIILVVILIQKRRRVLKALKTLFS